MGAQTCGSENKTTNYEIMEAGTYPMRCIQVVELGTHQVEYQGEMKDRKELMIVWETNELMEDGRPFTVNWRGTNSLNEKSKLYSMLTAWRGRKFTPEELKGFELKNILDKCCLGNITKETSKSGKDFNKVTGVMPLPKGMTCGDRHNDLVDFGIGDYNTEEANKLWPWVLKIISESHEIKNPNQSFDAF